MDERRVADYFVVAGLPDQPEPLGDFSRDGTYLKSTHNQAPITDVTVIFPGLGENVPPGYTLIDTTPTGFLADLNHGSLRSPDVYLCYRRGRDKPPLVDIGVMYEGKERVMADAEVVFKTPEGRSANVNNSAAKTFVTFRRAVPSMPCNELVVTDICVILTNKGETAPHAFCLINKNLNKGMVGSDVFLCYKKSMNRANLISYKPGILSRYPRTDHGNFPFPSSVPLFCLPMGASVECWPVTATQPRPVFSTFVLTVSDAAQKVYGSAVTFYERYPREELTPEQCEELELSADDDKTVNVNKCICLLSHWPFFDTFEKFLLFLYNMACEGPHSVPIERYISHFLENVPFPSPQRPRILVQLSATERVILTQPEDLPLPRSGAGFRDLLVNLGPDNCLMALLLVLTEQKILVHSLRPDVLTAVAEAMSMIVFPFKWQCPYIPLCPLGLAEVLHAPLPFLIGVDSRFFDLYDPPTDVCCVDLDTNTITVCEERKHVTAKLLPKKPARALRATLDMLFRKLRLFMQSISREPGADDSIDRDFQQRRKEQCLELEIQEAFLRFTASVLRGYRAYLLPITRAPTIGTTDPSSLFELQGFLRSRDKAHHKFFSLLMKTQMFIRFIEERSFVSDMDAGLAFFDECSERVDGDEEARLVELDELSHRSERTVFLPPPEPQGLPAGASYDYKGFVLDTLLFRRQDSIGSGAKLGGGQPGSPLARRTKHEIKSAQKLARKHAASPELWARCLLGTCYSLWFLHLPSYAVASQSRAPACLRTAYELLVRIHKMKLPPTDEVCYRVMMQLCGVYSQPVLAVQLLFHMKRSGLQPNAITYGFYNRAVLEATWPSDCTTSSQLLWNKLRNVIKGVALFRRAARKRSCEDSNSLADAVDGVSRMSIDSGNSQDPDHVTMARCGPESKSSTGSRGQGDSREFAAFDQFRSRLGSIVRPSGAPLLPVRASLQQPLESSAGLLMTGVYDGPPLTEEPDTFDCEGLDNAVPLPRPRNRSGSCSEFAFGRRAPTSPKASRPAETSKEECFRLLSRSESFANDAQIVDNLTRLRQALARGDAGHANGKAPESRIRGGRTNRSLFGRKGSLSLRRASRESSSENLAGSADGLDSRRSSATRLLSMFSREASQKTSPTRTPVTENDPLGALAGEENGEVVHDDSEDNGQPAFDSTGPMGILDLPEGPGGPLLFGGRGVSRSATFSLNGRDDELSDTEERNHKPMQRSSTMPVDVPAAVASGLSSFSSSFKLPFSSRFSPARLSLRKADLRSGTQLIENAIANFSPGSLTSRKSNELLQGGLNSLKSAATTVAKKFDEIKEAMSATSTPVKANTGTSRTERETSHVDDEVMESEGGRRVSSELSPLAVQLDHWGYNFLELFGEGSRKGSVCNLQPLGGSVTSSQQLFPENLYPRDTSRDSRAPIALEVIMTTCSKCHNCGSVLYDEEIMAGWVPEDSNLNTKCPFCGKATVPFLTVSLLDYRGQPRIGPAPSQESVWRARSSLSQLSHLGVSSTSVDSTNLADIDSATGTPRHRLGDGDHFVKGEAEDPVALEPITVPYLNPLVLRKELENILHHEGDSSLTQPRFVDEHPIIYWNMVLVFQRIAVVSHLPGLCLQAATVTRGQCVHPSWGSADYNNVAVRCLWDNPRLHEEVGQPMYILWQQNEQQSSLVNALVTDRTTVPRSVMQQVVSCVRCNHLLEPLKKLATERHKLKGRGVNRSHSLYRDILFLAFVAVGRKNIDQGAFDREYMSAFEKLPETDLRLFHRCDRPVTNAALWCRYYFRELEL